MASPGVEATVGRMRKWALVLVVVAAGVAAAAVGLLAPTGSSGIPAARPPAGAVPAVRPPGGVADVTQGDIDAVVATMSRCATPGDGSLSRCIADTLTVTADRTPAETIAVLYAWNRSYPEHGIVCHNVAHYLGQDWVARYDPGELIVLDTGYCDGGLVHGVVEGLAFVADDATFNSVIPTVCSQLEPQSSARQQCAHGAGHALVLRNPAGFLDMVERCTVVPEVDHTSCYTAVLMTYAANNASLSTEALPVPIVALDPSSLPTLCHSVPSTMVQKCWDGLWQLYPPELSVDALAVALLDACVEAATTGWERHCASSVGQMLFQSTPHGTEAEQIRNEVRTAVDRCPVSIAEVCTAGVTATATAWYAALHGSTDGYLSACAAPEVRFPAACLAGEAGDSAFAGPAVAPAETTG
jgi:hypothetical protein